MLNDLKITIPVFKPKDQLSTALNNMFVELDKDAKYYTTVFRTVVTLVAAGRRKIRENNIFNGSVPVRLFILYSLQNNYNGTIDTSCFNFPLHNYQNIDVSVNSVSVGTITNQKEAYSQLRDVLNRKYSEMPITFNQFINGYAVVAFDLTANHDTHLAVLPARASGVVNCEIDFSQNTAAGSIIFIGEFRNEIKVGLKNLPAYFMTYNALSMKEKRRCDAYEKKKKKCSPYEKKRKIIDQNDMLRKEHVIIRSAVSKFA